MAERKAYFGPPPNHPELDALIEQARSTPVTNEMLAEQRISFAYGNAPANSGITKESVRMSSGSIRITQS